MKYPSGNPDLQAIFQFKKPRGSANFSFMVIIMIDMHIRFIYK